MNFRMTEVSCLSIFLSTAAMPIFMFLFRFVNWAKFFHSKWNLISCIVLNTKRRSMDCVEQLGESFSHGSGITSHPHRVLPLSDWIEVPLHCQLLPLPLPLTFYFCHGLTISRPSLHAHSLKLQSQSHPDSEVGGQRSLWISPKSHLLSYVYSIAIASAFGIAIGIAIRDRDLSS